MFLQITPEILIRKDWVGGVVVVGDELFLPMAFMEPIQVPYEGDINNARNDILMRLLGEEEPPQTNGVWIVYLTDVGDKKINSIKNVRTYANIDRYGNPLYETLGLKEAKDIVDLVASPTGTPIMFAIITGVGLLDKLVSDFNSNGDLVRWDEQQ